MKTDGLYSRLVGISFLLCIFSLVYFAPTVSLAGQNDFEYWCQQAQYHDRRVEKARTAYKEEEENLRNVQHENELYNLYKGKMGKRQSEDYAQYRVEQAQKELDRAEEAQGEFEDKARINDVPNSWLRCEK